MAATSPNRNGLGVSIAMHAAELLAVSVRAAVVRRVLELFRRQSREYRTAVLDARRGSASAAIEGEWAATGDDGEFVGMTGFALAPAETLYRELASPRTRWRRAALHRARKDGTEQRMAFTRQQQQASMAKLR
jgi:hypothetical protein